MLSRRDFIRILIIGAAVGLLIQPILANNLPARYAEYLTLVSRLGIVVFFMVFAALALWIAKLLARVIPGLYQFAQFAAVGTLNSFIYGGILSVETILYGTTDVSNALFAVFISVSFLFSTFNSLLWNKYWTFASSEKMNAKQVGGFYGVAIVGWALSVGVATFVKSLGPADSHVWVTIVAPLAGILSSFIWNFTGYKLWVFKKQS